MAEAGLLGSFTRSSRPSPPRFPHSGAGSVPPHGLLGHVISPSSGAQADDLAALRRKQAEFHTKLVALDKQNSWMAAPIAAATAPMFADIYLETGAATAARAATQALRTNAFQFPERDPYKQYGDNYLARVGRRAHADLTKRVELKAQTRPGWKANEGIEGQKSAARPDVTTPRGRTFEMKPNTPAGRKAGARAIKKYAKLTGKRSRVIYYDPKNFK